MAKNTKPGTARTQKGQGGETHQQAGAAFLNDIKAKTGIGTDADDSTVFLTGGGGIKAFIAAAKKHRIWDREPPLRAAGAPSEGKAKKRI